ncbi:hypothetical protein FEZ32_07435 [Acidipropionibacterium jensenii]|uniref:hypothetical protein n=1 Tax=Acidipropionibacterium jensenii TaxID=1749 RepID=UPI00110A8E57|nr:hypothetical protein [Acidipropionibacterium jensenii]QCV88207.1 hypothetical protein FEZ32_07435 [Acidipropionibacterium jensenii]
MEFYPNESARIRQVRYTIPEEDPKRVHRRQLVGWLVDDGQRITPAIISDGHVTRLDDRARILEIEN